jgi:exodeoxyribonuclease VII small subunit
MAKVMKFEDALKRLEDIVERMENADVDLDKSLALYEEGIKLVRFCSSKLEEAKSKVEVLVKKNDKLVPEPFSTEETENEDKDL